MAFRCVTAPGWDLCGFGGTCVNGTACTCVPDSMWTHDDSFFNNPNCFLPQGTYLVGLAVNLVVTTACMVVVVLPGTLSARGHLKRFAFMQMCQLACFTGMAISCYVQDRWSRSANACFMVTLWALALCVWSCFEATVFPFMDSFVARNALRARLARLCLIGVTLSTCVPCSLLKLYRD